ncbi:hypothetical protein CCACVL1_03028 [Corchorus capsularis]|uniref:Uncharacterized protein n=1 Tax=Corchorus capsularis TaxID=210143 RepID=A0A1R3K3M8_COCAP|nr:hypothetical protein CCACVL1_03028 [Corchorus capsularis]
MGPSSGAKYGTYSLMTLRRKTEAPRETGFGSRARASDSVESHSRESVLRTWGISTSIVFLIT